MPARLLPAPVPDTAAVAHAPVCHRHAYLFLVAGAVLTLLTHLTNPGALGSLGGLIALVLLHVLAHRSGQDATTTIDLHRTNYPTRWGWASTGTATLAWSALILGAGTAGELALRVLLDGTFPVPAMATVLLPGLAATVAILTATLLDWAGAHWAETSTMAACAVALIALAAQGEAAVPGVVALVPVTVGLVWLYRRTHRGVAVYVADVLTSMVALVAVQFSPG